MRIKQILVPLTLGLTLALGLVWVLSAPSLEVRAAPGDVLCVTHDGGSYSACTLVFTNVQAAVDTATGGEEIRVATGVYTGVQARAGITQVVYITKTVTVRGGYTTTNGFASPPDPTANPTTLDAGGLGRVLVISGTITPTLEELRITGGDAAGLGSDPWGTGDAGGGVYVLTATVTIHGCTIYSNTASTTTWGRGGGLYLWNSAATLIGNVVQDNTGSSTAAGYGGGMFVLGGSTTLSGNTVQGNLASPSAPGYGGGLYLQECSATLSSDTVQGNLASPSAPGYGGGLYLQECSAALSSDTVQGNTASTISPGYGGGAYLMESDVTVNASIVEDNTASRDSVGYGGGLWFYGGTVTLSGNTVRGNVASRGHMGFGGGVHLDGSIATLNRNTVVSNTATPNAAFFGHAGGLYVWGSSPFTLTNNLVADNHANHSGSGLYIGGWSADPAVGRLLHNTIADNHSSGQGVYVDQYTTLAFTNTIIAGHSSVGISVTAGSTVTLEATLWHGNGAPTGGGTVISSTNVTGDPAFVNPSAWDYHLAAGSAAVDEGVDAGVNVDIDGDPRPAGAGYDLGADELWYEVYLPLVLRNH